MTKEQVLKKHVKGDWYFDYPSITKIYAAMEEYASGPRWREAVTADFENSCYKHYRNANSKITISSESASEYFDMGEEIEVLDETPAESPVSEPQPMALSETRESLSELIRSMSRIINGSSGITVYDKDRLEKAKATLAKYYKGGPEIVRSVSEPVTQEYVGWMTKRMALPVTQEAGRVKVNFCKGEASGGHCIYPHKSCEKNCEVEASKPVGSGDAEIGRLTRINEQQAKEILRLNDELCRVGSGEVGNAVGPDPNFTQWVVANRFEYDHTGHTWFTNYIGGLSGRKFKHSELYQLFKGR